MTIVWGVSNLKGAEAGSPYGVIVTDVGYTLTAAEGDMQATRSGNARLAKIKPLADGSISAIGVDQESFLQYDTITEQDVVQWVKQSLGAIEVETLERTVEQELRSKLNAPVKIKPETLTPPWEI